MSHGQHQLCEILRHSSLESKKHSIHKPCQVIITRLHGRCPVLFSYTM